MDRFVDALRDVVGNQAPEPMSRSTKMRVRLRRQGALVCVRAHDG
jgi:hypothetical protein